MDALNLHEHIGFLVRRAQQAHAAAWQREVSADVTSVQFGVLNVLRRYPGASQRTLCDELDLDRSTIADIVARLQRRGLVHRVRDGADRRRNVLRLTEAGVTRFEQLLPGARRVDGVLAAGLNATERAELHRLLLRLLNAAGGVAPGGVQ